MKKKIYIYISPKYEDYVFPFVTNNDDMFQWLFQ